MGRIIKGNRTVNETKGDGSWSYIGDNTTGCMRRSGKKCKRLHFSIV